MTAYRLYSFFFLNVHLVQLFVVLKCAQTALKKKKTFKKVFIVLKMVRKRVVFQKNPCQVDAPDKSYLDKY